MPVVQVFELAGVQFKSVIFVKTESLPGNPESVMYHLCKDALAYHARAKTALVVSPSPALLHKAHDMICPVGIVLLEPVAKQTRYLPGYT